MYVRPERVNAHKTLGTGMDVCCDMNCIVDASDKLMWHPYLTHSLSVNMRTFPFRGRIRLRIWIARSVEHRYRTVLLTGLDALNEAADGEEGSPF